MSAPAAKGLLAGAGKQDCADAGIFGEQRKDALQVVKRLRVQGVEHLRPVQRDGRDGTVVGKEQRVVRGQGERVIHAVLQLETIQSKP